MTGVQTCALPILAGMVMSSGYDALWYPVCYACGYLFLLLFIAGPLRRFGAYTIPDFAEGRYDSPLFRKIAVCFVLFIGFFYTMPQMKGAGVTLAYIFPGMPYWVGVVVVGAVITFNVALGGMKGITLVQAFQYWAKMFAISVPVFVLMSVVGFYNGHVGANAGEIGAKRDVVAVGGIEAVVAAIVDQVLPHHRRNGRAGLVAYVLRRAVGDVVNLVGPQRVPERLSQILGQRITRAQAEARGPLAIPGLVQEVARRPEQVEAARYLEVGAIRVGEAKIDFLPLLRQGESQPEILPAPEQVAFANADVRERAVLRRVSDAERQLAGGSLLDLDVDNRPIRRLARNVGDVNFLEVPEVSDPLARAAELGGVERIALDQAELTPNHPVERANIAEDVDALDIDARAFLNLERHGQIGRAHV